MSGVFSWEYALALWMGMFGVGYVIGYGLKAFERIFEQV